MKSIVLSLLSIALVAACTTFEEAPLDGADTATNGAGAYSIDNARLCPGALL
jgi:hypothetical protein